MYNEELENLQILIFFFRETNINHNMHYDESNKIMMLRLVYIKILMSQIIQINNVYIQNGKKKPREKEHKYFPFSMDKKLLFFNFRL